MIKEIALDPMAAPEPNEMHTLLKLAFGAHCGRYLSDFPSNDW